MPYNSLTPEEQHVIEDKGTEPPFTGQYDNFFREGTYICRKCNAPLFSSEHKFDAHCGWPAFDRELPETLRRLPDGDRTEIQCSRCGAHLGHVFQGEGFTKTDTRHCVNSLSIRFIPKGNPIPELV